MESISCPVSTRFKSPRWLTRINFLIIIVNVTIRFNSLLVHTAIAKPTPYLGHILYAYFTQFYELIQKTAFINRKGQPIHPMVFVRQTFEKFFKLLGCDSVLTSHLEVDFGIHIIVLYRFRSDVYILEGRVYTMDS